MLDLQTFTALIIISGDGLIHEVINGLMLHQNWSKAIKIPLGVIPGGSGNALAACVHEQCGEPFLKDFPRHAALLLTQAVPAPLDLIYLESLFEERYAFLSVGWGLIADIDIESEKFRLLGETRFTVGAVQRLLDLRTYSGTLSYLPADTTVPSHAGGDSFASPLPSSDPSVPPTTDASKPPTDLLPSLNDPVPSSWTTISGDFVSVYLVNVSRLGISNVAVPWAKLNDGLMHIFWMRAGAPKSAVLNFLLNLGTGEHLKSPHVEVAACRAFRLEPAEKNGILTVDGERVQYGPIQGQVLPSMACVMSRRKPETFGDAGRNTD